MSSVGQAAGGVIGAVVGFFVGGPSGALYGARLGMMAGGYLDPPKGPTIEGPRLDDLTVQTSTYGAVIPRLHGTISTAGNVFWLENNKIKEKVKKTKSGGKGGGSGTTTKTYSYYATFAVGLCQGPIVGIRRLWVGSKLIYDAGSSSIGAIIASNAAAKNFTVHLGTDDQLPDDRMQATLGVDNTPAYRGLAYIVFKDFPLADYGNSLLGAQVKAEVIASGAASRYITTKYTLPVLADWNQIIWNGEQFVIFGSTPVAIMTSKDLVAWTQRPAPKSGNYGIGNIAYGNGRYVSCISTSGSEQALTSDDGVTWVARDHIDYVALRNVVFFKGAFFASSGYDYEVYRSIDGVVWQTITVPLDVELGMTIYANDEILLSFKNFNSTTYAYSSDGFLWYERSLPANNTWLYPFWFGSFFLVFGTAAGGGAIKSADGINWILLETPFSGTQARSAVWDGEYIYVHDQNKTYLSSDGENWFWYISNDATANYEMTICVDGVLCSVGFDGAIAVIQKNGIVSNAPTLGEVVQSEFLLSNVLSPSDIETSALTQSVRGYKISSVAALRSNIGALQGASPFDVIQHGYKIQCKPRGGASVATIPANDLDARGSGSSPGVSITAVREMDSVLPRRVALSYLDAEREYDTGTQYAERLNTDAVNVQSSEMALVMTAGEAAKVAEVLLYLYWMERYSVSFSLPSSYNHLEPGDVITVQASEGTYNLRLTEITYTQDGRLDCNAKYNAAATYVSTAQGVAGPVTNQTLAPIGASILVLMDIPLMLDSTDQAGYVVALSGSNDDWPGGVIVRSDDGGQTWTEIQGVASPGSVIGVASTTIGSGRTDIFDTASALGVLLTQGELSSVSELSVLNGSNWFAYGAHGRWEIIGAKNCTLQSDGSYLLTDLLRGLKGTEWACGLHEVGDSVVLLDTSLVDFVGASLDSIGKSRIYRGVTAGQEIEAVSDREFTYSGVNIECLSPVYLNGSRHPSTNDWSLTWVRRTRVGGEWRDYVDATLGEASESYEVEIYSSNTYATLKRTLTGLSTPAAAYTSAQQVTDFGSNQATLYVKVYQLSVNVGRGYPLTTSITR